MSLFQCDKCGCMENTALTNAGHSQLKYLYQDETEFLADCRKRLGLEPDAPLGNYCSACTPIWYTESGDLGIGSNPNPQPEEGLWHGKFERIFYPLGSMRTNREGNLVPK